MRRRPEGDGRGGPRRRSAVRPGIGRAGTGEGCLCSGPWRHPQNHGASPIWGCFSGNTSAIEHHDRAPRAQPALAPTRAGNGAGARSHGDRSARSTRPSALRRPRHRLVGLAVKAERTEREGHRHLARRDRDHPRRSRGRRRAFRATRQRVRRPGPRRLLADRAGALRRRCRVRRRGRARVPRVVVGALAAGAWSALLCLREGRFLPARAEGGVPVELGADAIGVRLRRTRAGRPPAPPGRYTF
jgi:hypothetical protein